MPNAGVLLDCWVALLRGGQEATDPAHDAFERLRTLLAQSDEDTTSVPGWTLLRLRGETVAYCKVDEPYWRVPTGTPAFETRVGKSAVQLYGQTWLRQALLRPLDGRPSKTLGAPHRKTAAAVVIARSVLADADDVETF